MTWYKRFGQIAVGHTATWILDMSFDNVLYPFVLYHYGPLYTWVMMTIASGLICFGLIHLYEKMRVDWFGVDVVEEVKERGEPWLRKLETKKGFLWFFVRVIAWIPAKIFLLVLWLLKKNDVCAFFALCIYQDAFKTVVFLRHGRFDGLKKKDWYIFFSALLISNLYWTLRWTVILEVAKYFYRLF